MPGGKARRLNITPYTSGEKSVRAYLVRMYINKKWQIQYENLFFFS